MHQWMLHTEAERENAVKMSRDGLTALFLYCNKILYKGESRLYDEKDKSVRAIGKDSKIFVPAVFFEEILGCKVEGDTLSLGERSFKATVYAKDGANYFLMPETANALGFDSRLYYENRLVVIATPEMHEKIAESEAMEEAVSYAVFGRYDATVFTSDDYKAAKDQWRLRIVGSPEINDMTDPAIAEKVKEVENKCRARWSTMNKGENPIILWGNSKPIESNELSKQYGGIFAMAAGWGTYGCEFYHNEELLCDIIFGLDWMYENMYGEAEMRNEGWRDVFACNWWYWFVGGPEYLLDTLLIIEDHITMEDKKRYLKCFEWITTVMRTAPNRASSSSRVEVCTQTAILLEDPERLQKTQEDCDILLGIEEYGEGPHRDYVQWTHTYPHNTSYGTINLSRTLFVLSILASTPLDYSCPKKYNQFMLLKYMFETSMYHGRAYMMFAGRSTHMSETDLGAGIIADLLPMVGVYGEDEDFYIKRFVKKHSRSEQMQKKIKERATIYSISTFNSILADDTIPDDYEYEYAHAWFTGDRATQHRNNYAIGIALSSEREITYESILGLNKQGWYTADGATHIYTAYDKEQFDNLNFINKNLEVAYHVPGTTEDEQPRVARSINSRFAWKNPTAFAGSMQFEDKYITAAMEYISMHYDGPDDYVDDGYGGCLAPHANDLRAKKAYFCFDNEVVCLGAGITSTMDSPVNTHLEHVRIIDDEKYSQYVDGAILPKENFTKIYAGATRFLMEGHAGFFVLDGKKTFARRYVSETNQSFVEFRIQHGKNPTEDTYAYAILPYITKEQLDEYAKAPDVQVIANTAAVQAARENKLGITGFAFYEAGECDGIRVSDGCLVTKKDKDGKLTLLVNEPTFKLDTVTLTLEGEYKLTSAHRKASVSYADGKTVITFDFKEAHGRAYEVCFNN